MKMDFSRNTVELKECIFDKPSPMSGRDATKEKYQGSIRWYRGVPVTSP